MTAAPLYLDPEHRHQELAGNPNACMCSARLVVVAEFWNQHDQPLWWWLLPDGTLWAYPDPRPARVQEDAEPWLDSL